MMNNDLYFQLTKKFDCVQRELLASIMDKSILKPEK